MEAEVEIFQLHNPQLKKFLKGLNYEIHKTEGDSNLCTLYFSSHDIYYPNTEKAFFYSISERNRFEWKKNFYPGASLHIFLRDLKKQWYLEGINEEINNINSLYEFLKDLTKGYKIITIGSSAGGFAAILFGSMLHAEKVFSFNPQLNLNIVANKSNYKTDPLLFKYQKDELYNQYFDLNNFLKPGGNVYYFHSAYSGIDKEQKKSLSKDSPINIIRFKTSNHGFPFLRSNIPYVFSLSDEKLVNYSKRINHPVIFSFGAIGFFNTLSDIGSALFNRMKKKLIERLNRKN